jgi:hypothetical protein
MEIRSVDIQRFFGIVRQQHKLFGDFTLFGFDSDNGTVREARVDGHPKMQPGRYLFCLKSSDSKDWNILAYVEPLSKNPVTNARPFDLVTITLFNLILWILLIPTILAWIPRWDGLPLIFFLSVVFSGLILLSFLLRTFRRLVAVKILRIHLNA